MPEPTLREALERAEEFGQAGDYLAEMLGYALACIDAGAGDWTDAQLDAGRRGIAIWHRMRAIGMT